MKKRLFTFICMMAVLFIGQNAWAKQGDVTIDKLSQSNARLNSIVGNNYEYTTEDGFMKVVISGDHAVEYSTTSDAAQNTEHLRFGRVKPGEKNNFKFSTSAASTGYSYSLTSARTLTKMVGTGGRYALGTHDEEAIGTTRVSDWTDQTVNFTTTTTEVSFYFSRLSGLYVWEAGEGGCMEKYELGYIVVPEAPTWNPEAADAKVTVNHTQDAYLHWIDLSSYIQVANSKFAGTVKYEAVGLDAKYVIWNADSTKCYIIKPGTYSFRAYIDKKDGVYCSSAYTATNLQITATADAAEQANAQIFYMVDDKLVNEKDQTNHVWEVSLTGPSTDHWVEYVYAFDGDLLFEKRTTSSIEYLEKTENRKDNFNVLSMGGQDSIIVTNADGGARSWLLINATKAGNHVTVVLNSELMFNTLVTSVSHQEGNDVFWDNNRVRFAHFNSDYSRKRTMEVTFTGVPDSLIMLYGNNSVQQSSNTYMMIEYFNGSSWAELVTIPGRPNAETDKYVRFAYQLNPATSMLRFSYWGAQNLGYIHDLTVTERKGWWMSVAQAPDSTLLFTGAHQKGGWATKVVDLKWYNLYKSFQDTLSQFNPDMFSATPSGIKQDLGLDKFQEDGKVNLGFKLDSAGVFNTYYMVWNGTPDTKVEVPGGKYVYGIQLKGVVKYNADELEITTNLPSDTVKMEPGDTLPKPFILKDTLGNIVTDSLNYSYEFFPKDNASVDSLGNIVAKCVGYTRVVAKLKENSLIPGGLTDTIYIFVDEQEKNVINWNKPVQIGRGEVLTDLATTADGAKITYAFDPAFATQVGSENKIQISNDTTGDMNVTAYAAATCDHLKMDSTITITILDIIEDYQVEIKDPDSLKNLRPGDSITNLIVVTDPETGDTLKTTYEFIPDSAAKLVDGNIVVISHAVDPITVIATTTGPGIKDRKDTIYLHVHQDFEEIKFTSDMPDTMLVGTEYLLGQYIKTKSGDGASKLYLVDSVASKATFNQLKRSVKPLDSAYVEIFAVAKGNNDFLGPDTTSRFVRFVYAVKDIDWSELGDLTDVRVKDDTIRTSDVPVINSKGEDITDQVTKDYEFQPDGMAHVTDDGDIVMDQAGDVTVIITTSGPGFETKVDTLYIHAAGYEVSEVVIPADLSNVHVGDTISMDGIKVYDQDGKDITATKVDNIVFSVEPEGAAVYDTLTNSFIVLSGDPFNIVCDVYGTELIPSPTSMPIPVDVKTYEDITVVLPEKPKGEEYLPGDTIKIDDIRVLDDKGNDITDLADIEITWKPKDAAEQDEDGNIIIKDAGELELIIDVTGEGIEDTEVKDTIDVDQFEVAKVEFPAVPEGGYHVGDVIDTDSIRLYDANGNDITDQADITYSFIPTDGAHLDQAGNIVIDKAGEIGIQVNVQGAENVAPTTETNYIDVLKYEPSVIVVPEKPEEDYTVGDKINPNDIQVLDKDGNDITNEGTVIMTWEPLDAAHINGKGELVFDTAGVITVTTCILGEGVKPMCVENTYIVRHDESGCYALMAQLWSDVLAVNNNEQIHLAFSKPLPQFVSYQWYKDEQLLAGENNQSYHIMPGEIKDSANYYVRAIGTDKKEYLMCSLWVKAAAIPAASTTFMVYPSVVGGSEKYTIEVNQRGTVNVTTSNGVAVTSYNVNSGKNVMVAPAGNGVYVLQFIPEAGKYEVQKLIVK